jgi:hypothetical protein
MISPVVSHAMRRRAPVRFSPLALCLLAALSAAAPAWAADPVCVDGDGNPTGSSTDQGIEDTGSQSGENATCQPDASAYGVSNIASGNSSSAFGRGNTASGNFSSAFGYFNVASGNGSAFGRGNTASGNGSSAFGYFNSASGASSSAFGYFNSASGNISSAIGRGNTASGASSSAFGAGNTVGGNFGSAFGRNNSATGEYGSAFGYTNFTSGDFGSAFGYNNTASGNRSSAFGYGSSATHTGSTAIGFQAIADRDYAVAVGQAGGEHQIIHLADGTQDTDAVNLRQLNAAIGGIGSYSGWNLSAGGGAGEAIGDGETVDFEADDPNGNLTVTRSGNTITYGFNGAPTFTGLTVGGAGGSFTIVSNTFVDMGGNVVRGVADGVAADDAVNKGQLDAGLAAANGDAAAAQATAHTALAAAGAAQATADQAVSDVAAAQGTADSALAAANSAQATADTAVAKADAAQATADTALAAANNAATVAKDYTDTRETAVRADMAAGDATTLASANAHADAGDAATLAESQAYTDTSAAQTLSSANAYTDSRFAAWNDTLDQYHQQMDLRFARTDERIDRMGAMSGAMAAAAMNTAGLPGRNRVGVGFSAQNGRAAMAVGYQRLVTPNASVSLGGAFSAGEGSISAGAGFSW